MTSSEPIVVRRFLVEEDKETTPQQPARKEASFPRSVNGKIFIGSGEDGDYLLREHHK